MDETLKANPFYFESPSDRWSFTDREELLPALTAFLLERGRRLLVYGRRRMGKTSLIRNAAAKSGQLFVYVDLSTAASLHEVARKLLAALPSAEGKLLVRLAEIAQKTLKSISIESGIFKLAAELRPEEGPEMLERTLNFIQARAEIADEPWTVCFDEFQEIRQLGGADIDWRIRGLIQDHRSLNYLFSGSDHRLVQWMTKPSAPFFKQLQQLEVGPIGPEHLISWIGRRARAGGAADFPYAEQIVRMAGPCTGDIVRLAKTVFDHSANTPPKPDLVATAMDAISLVELNGEFTARWHECLLTQRSVLRVIAAGLQPTASDTLRAFGLRSASTAYGALDALAERYILTKEKGGFQFDSPFFRRWVAFNAG